MAKRKKGNHFLVGRCSDAGAVGTAGDGNSMHDPPCTGRIVIHARSSMHEGEKPRHDMTG